MSENSENPPAFPTRTTTNNFSDGPRDLDIPGMTLRDYFAAAAIHGYLAGLPFDVVSITERMAELAKLAYGVADAMLAERDKKSGAV